MRGLSAGHLKRQGKGLWPFTSNLGSTVERSQHGICDLAYSRKKKWLLYHQKNCGLNSFHTFIFFIPAMSVPTLLENSIINHWDSERGDNFQCILSSFSVKILAWKCFSFSLWWQLSEVDFAGSLLFSSLWLLYLCCKSLIWCLGNCHVWAATLNGLMSFELIYKIH